MRYRSHHDALVSAIITTLAVCCYVVGADRLMGGDHIVGLVEIIAGTILAGVAYSVARE